MWIAPYASSRTLQEEERNPVQETHMAMAQVSVSCSRVGLDFPKIMGACRVSSPMRQLLLCAVKLGRVYLNIDRRITRAW